MTNETRKIDSSRFEVIKDAPIMEPIIQTYNIDELKARELFILESINKLVEEKRKELVEIQDLISIAQNLGLKTADVLQEEKLLAEKVILEEMVSPTLLEEKVLVEEVPPVGM